MEECRYATMQPKAILRTNSKRCPRYVSPYVDTRSCCPHALTPNLRLFPSKQSIFLAFKQGRPLREPLPLALVVRTSLEG
jgi:hypothetical protein